MFFVLHLRSAEMFHVRTHLLFHLPANKSDPHYSPSPFDHLFYIWLSFTSSPESLKLSQHQKKVNVFQSQRDLVLFSCRYDPLYHVSPFPCPMTKHIRTSAPLPLLYLFFPLLFSSISSGDPLPLVRRLHSWPRTESSHTQAIEELKPPAIGSWP